MIEFLSQPWPWYISGPLIGLIIPLLLITTGRSFGISSSLRHICAISFPSGIQYFKYNWKAEGAWNLFYVFGLFIGGIIAATILKNPDPIDISEGTIDNIQGYGITDLTGLVPSEIISWSGLITLPGFITIVIGGFLLGFGARYAGGCTSGHGIMGLASFQKASAVAVFGFFVGGLIVTYLLYPLIF